MQLEVEYKNQKQQLSDYNDFFMKNQTALKKYRKLKRIIMLPIGIILSIFILVAKYPLMRIHKEVTPEDIVYILVPTIIGILWCVIGGILSYLIKKENFDDKLKDEKINFDEKVTVSLLEEGIKYTKEHQEVLYKWDFVKKLEDKKDVLYVIMKDNSAIIIPIEAFNENVTKDKFINFEGFKNLEV